MNLEMSSLCKGCATIPTNEWSLAQVNVVHMTLQMCFSSEELPTGVALERLQPKVDGLVVLLHSARPAKDLAAGKVTAWNIPAQMSLTKVLHHPTLPREWFAACRA